MTADGCADPCGGFDLSRRHAALTRCPFFGSLNSYTHPLRAAQPQTGLMVWDAARVLCRLVETQCPVALEGMSTRIGATFSNMLCCA